MHMLNQHMQVDTHTNTYIYIYIYIERESTRSCIAPARASRNASSRLAESLPRASASRSCHSASIHIYIPTYIHTYTRTHTYICMYIHTYMCIYRESTCSCIAPERASRNALADSLPRASAKRSCHSPSRRTTSAAASGCDASRTATSSAACR